MFRVQVKATSFKRRDHAGYICRIAPARSSGYPDEVLDFITAYVIPEDVWYIIPFAELAAKIAVNLDPGREENRYRYYREAWDLLLAETSLNAPTEEGEAGDARPAQGTVWERTQGPSAERWKPSAELWLEAKS